MTAFSFEVHRSPFPRWFGPFSPSRGTFSGFRFHSRRLGTWLDSEIGRAFWSIVDTPGVRSLSGAVLQEWGGGRVLLLPNGLAIKPLQADYEVGRRVVVGRFHGDVVLQKPDGGRFDMASPGQIVPGGRWHGPKTTGLECIMQSDGSLSCHWYHPTETGREEAAMSLHGPDRILANGFRNSRPGHTCGRVRVTANGHVITNRQERDGTWISLYVGYLDPATWPHLNGWIGGSNHEQANSL